MPPPGRVTDQITWVYTENLATSVAFYEDILGLAVLRDAGTARIYRTGPGAAIGVCETFADRVVEPKGGMVTLITDDVDGWYAALAGQGADLLGPPEIMARFGIYSFFVRDPNGYLIEIQTFLKD